MKKTSTKQVIKFIFSIALLERGIQIQSSLRCCLALSSSNQPHSNHEFSRRMCGKTILNSFSCLVLSSRALITTPPVSLADEQMLSQGSLGHLGGFKYNDEWIGTELPLMSIESASNFEYSSYDMARWPDQILRRPAGMISKRWIGSNEVKNIAYKLRNTANMYGAVGLAAQQCGIDASIIFLDTNTSQSIVKKNNIRNIFSFYNKASGSELNDSTEQGIFLINPRIVARSPEVDMKVWIEKCLVLPPEFTATVLRDSIVTVSYQNLEGDTVTSTFQGELARAVQHEMDHDRGILILDHIGLEEMETEIMQLIETSMHSERMQIAYSRDIANI